MGAWDIVPFVIIMPHTGAVLSAPIVVRLSREPTSEVPGGSIAPQPVSFRHSVTSTDPGVRFGPCALKDQVHDERVLLFTVDRGQVRLESVAAFLCIGPGLSIIKELETVRSKLSPALITAFFTCCHSQQFSGGQTEEDQEAKTSHEVRCLFADG